MVQTVMFLQKSNIQYFLKYLPAYFLAIFVVLVKFIAPKVVESVSTFMKNLDPWPVDQFGPVLERHIKYHANYFNIFATVTVAVSFISGIFHALPVENDEEIMFTLAFFQEYFPKWKNCLSTVYRLGFLVLPFAMLVPFHIFIYAACHCQQQIFMLLHIIEVINKTAKTEQNRLLRDEKYQKRVTTTFKFIIKRHCHLMKNGRDMVNQLRVYIFVLSASAGALFICGAIYITFQGLLKGRYLRLVTLIIPVVLIFVHVFFLGQRIEDMSGQGFEVLRQSNWYHWNKENKMIYSIILANCKESFKIQFSQSIAIDYKLAVSILKSVYSTLSILGYLRL
ncbi:hypothetical protein Zmor_002295 [Zophobas morio]|uniref:Odorant receptor n=1 Tax=Zophobas morio TaxID=2755281 RepID=A0AA38J0A5_9CUCU|nr:hypothetical protein Zmor_002295 [Zophobas morio]